MNVFLCFYVYEYVLETSTLQMTFSGP